MDLFSARPAASPHLPDPTDVVDLAVLHRENWLGLVRVAAPLVGDRATAEDVVQEAFTAVHARWGQLRDQESALGYVRASVVNGARSALRRRRLVGRFGDGNLGPLVAPAADLAALANLQNCAVYAAVEALPRRQREVIILRYLGGLSVAQTARALGVSVGAVKASATRAMSALAVRLEAENGR